MKKNNKIYLVFLWGFGLGPGSDVTRPSPSRGEKLSLKVGALDVGFGLVPHFALGPITNVSSTTSSGGDSLVVGVNDVDGWLDIGGSKFLNAGVSALSNRTPSRVTAHTAKTCQTGSATPYGMTGCGKGLLTWERVLERHQFRHRAGYG